MANTRSMTIKQKKFSTSDNDNSAASCGVCKSWRSVALSNWNKFMVSKQPMRLSIFDRLNKKDCYLEDYRRRKLKTTIPHSNGRICVGITCGYLIFYGRETHDFWLVNPFTRKQLHFPGFPFAESTCPGDFRGILVFSPSMSRWVFVVSHNFSISFSLAGKHARWRNVTSDYRIHDLHFFKGKIYMINTYNQLWELRLNLEPALTLLKMKNFPWPNYIMKAFLSSGENFYLRDIPYTVKIIEVNFDEMKSVDSERTIGEYAVFVSYFYKSDVAIKLDTWTHPWTQYERLNYFQNKESDMCSWYFPHDCLNVKDPDMKNGGLLNILKD